MTAAVLPSLTFCRAPAKEYASLILFVLAVLVQWERRHIYVSVIWMVWHGISSYKVNHIKRLNHFVGF